MRVKDVMTTKITKVSPDNGVRQAAQVMLDNHVSGVPVVDDEGRLVGVLSEGDLIRRTELISATITSSEDMALPSEARANAYIRRSSWRVGDAMTPDPVVIDEEASLAHVAKLMHERHIKRIPVVRDGKLVGIVSRADLLQAILVALPDDTAGGDEGIQRSIVARFGENTGLEGLDLSVTVDQGIVHIWGSVESVEFQRAACIVAEGVRGVKGVVEHFNAPHR
ncbi:CBS domain-containing protein [Rhizobium sp. Root1220]|uniref:CBS domain-containing protein n=1 Tax=Rhizobium sp. Root1220 TaxID=1736432 RepID=UPI0006F2EBE2|nr:CBS domain-containing protein [Rhizobium sp. Root1220]KQV66359.1 signal transduction protein [Rhizobium sp. Root1220]